MTELLWTKNHPMGYLALPAYPGDAGLDLLVVEDTSVPPGKLRKADCGINVAIPAGYCSLVISRSSMVFNGLMVMTTLIDEGYRGPLFVMLANFTDASVEITAGTRVAQLLILSTGVSGISTIKQVPELPESIRGKNGFGSSGDSVTPSMDDPIEYFDRISREKGINEYNLKLSKPPKDAEEHRKRILAALGKFEANSSSISQDVRNLFGINVNWGTSTNGKVLEFLIERKQLSETIDQFAKWWWSNDFRGKQGQPPTPTQIMQLWPQAFGFSPEIEEDDELDDSMVIRG